MITVYRVRPSAPARSGSADPALHAILARELGAPPRIVVDERGKPHLAGREIAFNVAHSGELAVIAIARGDVELGVDVERHRAALDAEAVARRFFRADEAALVAAEPAQFWRMWCRKEAWLKARGIGLAGMALAEPVPAGWLVEDVEVGAGYSAAVACAVVQPVRVMDFEA